MKEEKQVDGELVRSLEIDEKLSKKVDRRTAVIRLTGIFLGILILLLLAFLAMKLFVTVREIRVEGLTSYAAPDIVSASGIREGDMLLFVGKGKAEKNITGAFSLIKNVTVEREFPDTVILVIEEEKPEFYFEIEDYLSKKGKQTAYAVVSDGQKVLSIYDSLEAFKAGDYADLPKVIMPTVRYAVPGAKLVFESEGDSDYIPELLKSINDSSFGEDLVCLDVSCRFDIVFYTGKSENEIEFEIRMGNKKEMNEKLMLAQSIAEGHLDRNRSWMIDVSQITEAFARERKV